MSQKDYAVLVSPVNVVNDIKKSYEFNCYGILWQSTKKPKNFRHRYKGRATLLISYLNATQQSLLSTMNTTPDGKTFLNLFLRPPRKCRFFDMMVGRTHLVMKLLASLFCLRVYGLRCLSTSLLTIVELIEHPSFEDYSTTNVF